MIRIAIHIYAQRWDDLLHIYQHDSIHLITEEINRGTFWKKTEIFSRTFQYFLIKKMKSADSKIKEIPVSGYYSIFETCNLKSLPLLTTNKMQTLIKPIWKWEKELNSITFGNACICP